MAADFIAMNLDHTIKLMRDYLKVHQAELLIRNASDFAAVTSTLFNEYKRNNKLVRWLWSIGEAFTLIHPLPLSASNQALIDKLADINQARAFKLLEIHLERRELFCRSTYRTYNSDFDCWLDQQTIFANV